MGQNTLDQAKRFKVFSGLSGMILSKVDGTAKGGTVLNIVNEMRIPVKYIGTGETQADLEPFSTEDFMSVQDETWVSLKRSRERSECQQKLESLE